jgi:hypothetical protein
VRRCRPGQCDIKITGGEIARLQGVTAAAGGAWRDQLQPALREALLTRVVAYATHGHAALVPYADGRSAPPADTAAAIAKRSACLAENLPELAPWLGTPPGRMAPPPGSFLYWSKVGRQVFATHYIDGSLNVTAVVGDERRGGPFLVVLNRTSVDVFQGVFGGLARSIVERRLRGELESILDGLAGRLESGPPPV